MGPAPGDVVILVGTTPVSEKSFRAWYESAKTSKPYAIAYLRRNASGVYVRHARKHTVPQQPDGWLGAAAYDVYPERLRPSCVDYWKGRLKFERDSIVGLLIEITDQRPEFLTRHYSAAIAGELKDAMRERKEELKVLAKQQAHDPLPPELRPRMPGLRRNLTPAGVDLEIGNLARAERSLDEERKNNPPDLPLMCGYPAPLTKVGEVGRIVQDNRFYQLELIRKISDRSGVLAPR